MHMEVFGGLEEMRNDYCRGKKISEVHQAESEIYHITDRELHNKLTGEICKK